MNIIHRQFLPILLIFTLMCTATSMLLPSKAVAQSESGLQLTTSPLPINLATPPGKRVTAELRVQNSGPRPENLQVGLLKFTADSTTGQPSLLPREDGDDYFDWVSFTPSTLELAPNEWGTVEMTIDVPESAAFGYYYAVTFSRASETGQQTGTSTLQGAAATLVLLEAQVPGASRDLMLETFTTSKPWYEFLPVTFNVRIRNKGNVHAVPFGSVFIKRGDTQIDEITFNKSRGNILPNSPRTYIVSWENGFPVYQPIDNGENTISDSKPAAESELRWDFTQANNLRFGKYTAELVLAYDNGERDVPIESSVEFWVVPWKFIVGGVALMAFFVFGVVMFGRGIWRRVSRE